MSDTAVCPLCPLNCDDLTVSQFQSASTGCRLADDRLRRVHSVIADALSSRDSLDARDSLDTRAQASVIETAQAWIRDADDIQLAGNVIDWETARAISDLAASHPLNVVPTGGDSVYIDTFTREGGFLVTLGDVVARDDITVWTIGEVCARTPRLARYLESRRASTIAWPSDDALASRLAMVNRQMRGSEIECNDPLARTTCQRIREASYLCVLTALPLFDAHDEVGQVNARAAWSSLLSIIRLRNQKFRAALLSFDASLMLRSVLASRRDLPNSQPLTSLSRSKTGARLSIQLDPFQEHGIDAKSTDTRVGHRQIIIGGSKLASSEDTIKLPATVPGLHEAGIVLRGDGSVTLPLGAPLRGKAPSPFSTPSQLIRQLAGS